MASRIGGVSHMLVLRALHKIKLNIISFDPSIGLRVCRADLCLWDNRGKANSLRPPPPRVHKNFQKKIVKLCNIVTAMSLLN
jgi:hypothetical protein